MDPRIQTIIDLAQQDPARAFDLDTLAQATNISASHLRHLFRSETGMTLAYFIKRARLERAEQLLLTTFLSVKEIMNRVGIVNQSYFSREFKTMYGLAPGEYRRAQRKD